MERDNVVVIHPAKDTNHKPPAPPQPVPQGQLPAVAGAGLASLLIPCCGQLEHTKLCIPSVLRHTRPPFELLFLDIGSLDGTTEYLAGLAHGLAAAAQVRVEVVRAATDHDIPAACKAALAQARGEYLVLLNNDALVTDGWLDQLVALASMSFGVGMAGPMSNYAAPPQLVEAVPYRVGPRKASRLPGALAPLLDVAAVESFARQLRDRERGQWCEADRLGGFCLLLKREVLGRIGGQVGEAGLGLFDTDVLSGLARQAGYSLAVCRDLFVHHFGTRTFAHGAPTPPPVPEVRSGATAA
jgi:GT2 family glycosyltransferase